MGCGFHSGKALIFLSQEGSGLTRNQGQMMAHDLASPPLSVEVATPSIEAPQSTSDRLRPRHKSLPPKRLAPSSKRAYRCFDRRKRGFRCAMIELSQKEIDLLIKFELLSPDAERNPRTLGSAMNQFLENHPFPTWAYKSRR
jgi:hypothetical protein